MAFSVELNFDARTEAAIREMWQRLADRGVSRSMLDAEARPHVTLSVAESIDEKSFVPWLRHFAVQLRPFDLLFQSIGIFPTEEGVVFYSPTPTHELLAVHDGFHQALPDSWRELRGYYRPGRWIPHCTAAVYLDHSSLPEAVSICTEMSLPIVGQYRHLTLIETHPRSPIRTIHTMDIST